jgi:sarcosine oxidase gamma subunit
MSAVEQHNTDVQLEALPTTPIYELVTFRPEFLDTLPADWPKGPGEARCRADGSAEILRVAADRWLLSKPGPALITTSAALFAVCALTEVTGKWREFKLTGASAARLLANSVDVGILLAGRNCARTALFDCPALLYKLDAGFSVWIERSYEYAFVMAVEQAIAAQASAPRANYLTVIAGTSSQS